MDRPKIEWRGITEALRYFEAISQMSLREILSYATVALVLYISAGSAYILGFLAGLPVVLISMVNHATTLHLFGQLTFMVVIGFSLFKVSQLFGRGVFVMWTFTICKFCIGPKKPRGLRDQGVQRLQRRMNNAIAEGRAFRWEILLIRIAITGLFTAIIFFPITIDDIFVSAGSAFGFLTFFLLSFMAFFASLSAYRVGSGQSHRDFFTSPDGRKFVVTAALFLCVFVGWARSSSTMYGPTVNYSTEGSICEVAPMMPVYGGNLYFDQKSRNFVVISDGKISFYVPHVTSQNAPICI